MKPWQVHAALAASLPLLLLMGLTAAAAVYAPQTAYSLFPIPYALSAQFSSSIFTFSIISFQCFISAAWKALASSSDLETVGMMSCFL